MRKYLFSFGSILSVIGALGMFMVKTATMMLAPFIILLVGLFAISFGGDDYRIS
jgi:hypothetical protein